MSILKWPEAVLFYETNGYWKGITHPIAIARKFRRYYLQKYKHQCFICKRYKWNGQEIPLVLDHIDGKSNNWNVVNLRLICGNCDMQLPTYKNKNKGFGRAYRRNRYHNNQTF